MKRLSIILFCIITAIMSYGQSIPVIPYPQSVVTHDGTAPMSVAENITYQQDDSLAREAYRLNITTDGVTITSSTKAGQFYALQTLEQLKMTSTDGTLPLVDINDYPLLEYRSFMLDCSRHFFTKDAVKRILKIMSFYKVNYFHWHLNDDQGWRVEIPEYPKLTEIGSIRKGSLTLKDSPYFYDDTEYGRGCYYALDDLREVVAYADSLNIEIIPEYDMPGHNVAALAAYPELSCDSTKTYEVRITEGVSSDVLNVGDDRVIDFLKCVLGHLAEVFPSKYMHLGGDECPTTVWQTNALCQQRIQNEGLSSVNDLQPWLLETLGSWLQEKYGKQVVAWDELVDYWKTSYTCKPVIMCYRNGKYDAQAKAAAAKGLRSIVTPTVPCYFDQMQCTTSNAEFDEIYQGGYGASWVNSVQDVYNFNPLSAYTDIEDYCFGTQGSLWTEACCSEAEMQYQFLPRMLAVAENGWLPASKKSWTSFYNRLQYHDAILDSLGYAHGRHFIADNRGSLQKQQDEAKRLLDATNAEQTGYVSTSTCNALQDALTASYSNGSISKLKSAINTYKAADIAMPKDGALYQIRSAATYYLQRYLGSSLYLNKGTLKIHYTPQTEPQEIWQCTANEDGTYTFTSLLDGTLLSVNGTTALTVTRPTSANTKYDYDPGVLQLTNGTDYLYANASGTVTYSDEKRLDYPSSWRLEELTDYRMWMESLQTKCEREVEAWKPDIYGYRSEQAIQFLQDSVVSLIDNRLQETTAVSREEYTTFVDRYERYLQMPMSSLADNINEGCYYYIQNAYFTTAYACTEKTIGCILSAKELDSTDDKFRWRFIKQNDGTVRILNKVSDRPAYVLASEDAKNVRVTSVPTSQYAGYTWTLEEQQTDQGQTGVVILETSGTYSWYGNPGASTDIILRPKDWGASIWNLIAIPGDETPVEAITAPTQAVDVNKAGIYDMQGRRLAALPTHHGIYIVDGTKRVVR